MTPQEHYDAAERLLEQAQGGSAVAAVYMIGEAQVHALLALAAGPLGQFP